MRRHAELLAAHFPGDLGIRTFRKHASWYVTGYPVGPAMRRRLSGVSSLAELDMLLEALDHEAELPPEGRRLPRGHTNGPITPALPAGYLDRLDGETAPDESVVGAHSGG
jgi:hypothetical protein